MQLLSFALASSLLAALASATPTGQSLNKRNGVAYAKAFQLDGCTGAMEINWGGDVQDGCVSFSPSLSVNFYTPNDDVTFGFYSDSNCQNFLGTYFNQIGTQGCAQPGYQFGSFAPHFND